MALPVTFGTLTAATGGELDTNFQAVGILGTIPCVVSGTNSIVLAQAANTPTIAAYSNYIRFSGVIAVTNTGAVTCQLGSLAALPVYKDTSGGPVALTGSELVVHNSVIFIYDSALNSGNGGFHVQVLATGGAGTVTSIATNNGLTGGTITSTGTLGLASIATLGVLSNVTGGSAVPTANSMSAILDAVFGTSQGNVLYRGASVWAALAKGPAATPLQATSSNPAYGLIVSATTAAAGSSQGDAATIGNCNIVILTSVGANTGIILPTTVGLNGIYVCNRGGATVNVYPNLGAQIEALGANAASTIANNANGLFVSTAATVNVPTQLYRPI